MIEFVRQVKFLRERESKVKLWDKLFLAQSFPHFLQPNFRRGNLRRLKRKIQLESFIVECADYSWQKFSRRNRFIKVSVGAETIYRLTEKIQLREKVLTQ